MQLDLDAVNAWCNNNQITLNQAKTEYIKFSYRSNHQTLDNSLYLGDRTISKTDSYKYLGTVLDSKLNCQAQYNNLIRKLSVKKITFSKIRYLLDTVTAIAIYKACFNRCSIIKTSIICCCPKNTVRSYNRCSIDF